MFADQVNRAFGKADRERRKMLEIISSLEGRDLERLLKEAEERARLAEEGGRVEGQKARLAEEKLRKLEEKAKEVGAEADKVRADMVQTVDSLRRREVELKAERSRANGLEVQLGRAAIEAKDLRSLLARMEERVTEAEIRASDSKVETYFGGFRLCEKQVREKHPELDLSFLDMEAVEEDEESEPSGDGSVRGVIQGTASEVPQRSAGDAEAAGAEGPVHVEHPSSIEHPSAPEIMVIDPEGAE